MLPSAASRVTLGLRSIDVSRPRSGRSVANQAARQRVMNTTQMPATSPHLRPKRSTGPARGRQSCQPPPRVPPAVSFAGLVFFLAIRGYLAYRPRARQPRPHRPPDCRGIRAEKRPEPGYDSGASGGIVMMRLEQPAALGPQHDREARDVAGE